MQKGNNMDSEHSNYKKFLEKEKYTKIIAVDFDATIHEHLSTFSDWVTIADPPVAFAKNAMQQLKDDGWYIIVHTARIIDFSTAEAVKTWLARHEIPYDEIWLDFSKPYADIYLDDKGLQFNGDWLQTLEDIKNFKNWREGLRK